MKPAIEVIGEDRCTGCYACYSACPVHAIIMDLNEEGFLVPFVNHDACRNCGLCQEYCPIMSSLSKDCSNPLFFAGWSKNEKIRLQSSSGGVFSEIAKSIIASGGVVFGAAFDQSFILRHFSVEREEELGILRGSKYVQSHIDNAYQEAISIAMEDKPILFCGTPCQIAALNRFLDRTHVHEKHKEFYLCDFVCHGVPSELVFRAYLDSLTQLRNSDIMELSFRDKRISWDNYGSRVSFKDGSEYFKIHRNDSFMIGYLKNLYLRPICYECPFAKIPRTADITIGDFWGIPKQLHSPLGVSVVAMNNSRGNRLFSKLTGVYKVPVSIEDASRHNPRLINGHLEKPSHRADFFNLFRSSGYKKASDKYLENNFNFGYSSRILTVLKHAFRKICRR
jgi:coenzyme F420-reducing hydrogenase beta subunit